MNDSMVVLLGASLSLWSSCSCWSAIDHSAFYNEWWLECFNHQLKWSESSWGDEVDMNDSMVVLLDASLSLWSSCSCWSAIDHSAFFYSLLWELWVSSVIWALLRYEHYKYPFGTHIVGEYSRCAQSIVGESHQVHVMTSSYHQWIQRADFQLGDVEASNSCRAQTQQQKGLYSTIQSLDEACCTYMHVYLSMRHWPDSRTLFACHSGRSPAKQGNPSYTDNKPMSVSVVFAIIASITPDSNMQRRVLWNWYLQQNRW